jgi:hypothetical protein
VGFYYDDSEATVTLAESWNGHAWAVQPTPGVSGASFSQLNGVSCTSPAFCVAVGTYYAHHKALTLAETWNGSSWVVQSTPNRAKSPASELFGVSCVSAADCVAVGNAEKKPACFDCTPPITTLAELWNGTTWTLTAAVAPAAKNAYLYGVSCVSATACTAVGWYEPNFGTDLNLAEFWNGTRWSEQGIPNSPTRHSQLNGVSCTSASSCTAVGTSQNQSNDVYFTFAERWNGTSWAIEPTPNPKKSRGSVLYAVSCATAGACTAVGEWSRPPYGHPNVPFALTWNGTRWALVPTPVLAGPVIYSGLQGVSCPSARACVATGYYQSSSGMVATMAEEWDGTAWSLQRTPVAGQIPSYLFGVSCNSGRACMAVGEYTTGGGGTRTLAEDWNGRAWAIVATPSPAPGGGTSALSKVSCATPRRCLAVGDYQDHAGAYRPLAEAWNGRSWSVQATPNPAGASDSYLDDVSCVSPTACTAVGYYSSPVAAAHGFAESWNGASWTVQTTAEPSRASYTLFNGVSCTSATSCAAVGDFGKNVHRPHPLAEAWNGRSWSVRSAQVPRESIGSTLDEVSCTSATACTAVGVFEDDAHGDVTLAEAWNGHTWLVQATPNAPDSPASVLNGVSCTSATSCVAAGYVIDSSAIALTLAEVWNGTTWAIQATPNPRQRLEVNTGSGLWSVSCTRHDTCTAVGYSANDTFISTPVAERVSEACPKAGPLLGRMCRGSYSRQSSWPSGHRMSTAHAPPCLAHARTVHGRQVASLWSTSAALSFGSCRMRSIRSPAGTLASMGQVPVTGGGYPPNPGSPSLTWQTITYSNRGETAAFIIAGTADAAGGGRGRCLSASSGGPGTASAPGA